MMFHTHGCIYIALPSWDSESGSESEKQSKLYLALSLSPPLLPTASRFLIDLDIDH